MRNSDGERPLRVLPTAGKTHDGLCEFLGEVEAQLVRTFSSDAVDQARVILNPGQDDRVLRAVLTLAAGLVERLRLAAPT